MQSLGFLPVAFLLTAVTSFRIVEVRLHCLKVYQYRSAITEASQLTNA